MGLDGVVPFAVEGISGKIEGCQFVIGNLEASWVGMAILESGHRQAFFGRRMRDELKNDLKGGEGLGPPIDGNEGKELMLDLVPFAGRRWIVSAGDREARLVGQLLQLLLPQSVFRPIGAASISGNEQLLLAWIERFATALPPSSDALDGELSCIMINAYIDEATVVDQIVDAIRYRFA